MKFHILAVGHKMPDWIQRGYTEYSQRMPKEAAMQLIEIKPEKRVGKSSKSIERLLLAESERICSALPPQNHIIVLDERGKQCTTISLAKQITYWMQSAQDVTFIIGSADGLHQSIKQMAHERLALSTMTLPHGLARILLAEQLYRALSITRNHPYHRA